MAKVKQHDDERLTEDAQLLTPPKQEYALAARESWRVFRIMGEFVDGFEALADVQQAVTIFGSARIRPNDGSGWYEKTVELSRQLGKAGLAIITGGGPGVMEAANKGAHEADALSIGLNIDLPFEQHVNPYVDVSVDFRYFFARKMMLVKYSQAFVVMPGGFGTMDELFEALTLIQTGKIRDFPVVLFGTEYWGGLMDWLQNSMQANGKVSQADLDLIVVSDSPEEVCEYIISCMKQNPQRRRQEAEAREVTRHAQSKQ